MGYTIFSELFPQLGAIDYALTLLDEDKCVGCKRFAFKECDVLAYKDRKETGKKMKKRARLSGITT